MDTGTQALLARMEPLLEGIAARAADGERLRRLPEETVVELAASGVFKAMIRPSEAASASASTPCSASAPYSGGPTRRQRGSPRSWPCTTG